MFELKVFSNFKLVLFFLFLFPCIAIGAPVNECDRPNQPEYYYDFCPTTKQVRDSVIIEQTEVHESFGESFKVDYTFESYTEVQKKGAFIVQEKKKLKINKIDVEVKNDYCDIRKCDLSDYEFLINNRYGNAELFLRGIWSEATKERVSQNILITILEFDTKAKLVDVLKLFDTIGNHLDKTLYIKFVSPHGNVQAYIRLSYDAVSLDFKFTEYLYRKQEGEDVSWIGNRDYDLNASNALWEFMWERGLRRTKRCINTIVRVNNPLTGQQNEFLGTECWYTH